MYRHKNHRKNVIMSASTGFTNIILPKFEGGKDVSDYYKSLQDPKKFKETILKLFSYD